MPFGKIKILVIFFLSSVITNSFANSTKPFSHLQVNIQYCNNTNEKVIHNYWHVKNGLNFYYETPFYIGKILGGLSFFPYESKSISRPDFQNYFIYLGWLYDISIGKKYLISPGIKIGNNMMNFDIESEYDKFESEISTEVFCRVKYQMTHKIHVSLEYGNQNIYTYKLIKFNFIKAGLALELERPSWLMDLFR